MNGCMIPQTLLKAALILAATACLSMSLNAQTIRPGMSMAAVIDSLKSHHKEYKQAIGTPGMDTKLLISAGNISYDQMVGSLQVRFTSSDTAATITLIIKPKSESEYLRYISKYDSLSGPEWSKDHKFETAKKRLKDGLYLLLGYSSEDKWMSIAWLDTKWTEGRGHRPK